jgi:hypothetical protein
LCCTLHANALQPSNAANIEPGQPTAAKKKPKSLKKDKAAHTEAPASSRATTIPDDYKLNMLIRTTIIAVSQANKTGNYSVLRDLGSPNFQIANSEAKLTDAFAEQRNAHIDLSPVLFFQPKLIRKPEIDGAGMLRLTGFVATQPNQVNFDLAFEHFQGEWRFFGLSVGTQHATPPSVSAQR